MNNTEMLVQIKKERLNRHLAEVERLIEDWIPQLYAPDPFAFNTQNHSWGWASAYRPVLEQDPDSNHMLRQHVRSRALWRNHSDWEGRLNQTQEVLGSFYKQAIKIHKEMRKENRKGSKRARDVRQYAVGYEEAAIWQAFHLACGERPSANYTLGDHATGVRFGDFLIETAAGAKSLQAVESEHYQLSCRLSRTPQMGELAAEWALIRKLEERMRALATKALKSSDYLYPCRYCRRLWAI